MIISFIEEPHVFARILAHLGLLAQPSPRAPPDDLRYEPFLDDLPAAEEDQVVRTPFRAACPQAGYAEVRLLVGHPTAESRRKLFNG